jgi:hypothetical protein
MKKEKEGETKRQSAREGDENGKRISGRVRKD